MSSNRFLKGDVVYSTRHYYGGVGVSEFSELAADVLKLTERVSTIEGALVTWNTTLESAMGELATVKTTANNADTLSKTNQQNISTLTGTVNGHTSEIEALNTKCDENYDSIVEVDTTLSANYTQNCEDIKDLTDIVSSINEDIAEIGNQNINSDGTNSTITISETKYEFKNLNEFIDDFITIINDIYTKIDALQK